ncbi:hypothetical protein RF11_02117 [Thelohanellus kitauei]|uniref:Tc1-like transposase DDE domain-containing protein n=1 Tax=Thelohanellus kitauei TaxID=669202 RepID=A0A0C2MMG0_THEKT|nr:hypothetical protein RF11_02117 [Thelohanellus kitauei]
MESSNNSTNTVQDEENRSQRKTKEALIIPKSNMIYLRKEILENIVTIISETNAVTLHGIQSTLGERGVQHNSSGANLNARKNYCRVVNDITDKFVIFIDETSINLHLNSHYGQSWPEYIMPGCHSISGVVAFCIDDGANNGNSFMNFLESQLFPLIGSSSIIIMDNARIHKVREHSIRIYAPIFSSAKSHRGTCFKVQKLDKKEEKRNIDKIAT